MRIVTSEDYPELVGKYLSELAEERRVDPFDVVAELALDADHPVYITLGAIKEWEVRELIVQPWNMIASDGAYLDRNSTSGHPRGTGTFPRLLGHYVRDEGLLPLEEAVRKITSFPADFLGLTDRGRIQEGLIADLVVFDPETIIDRSTWTEPQLFSEGVVHLLVNGVPVLRDRELTGEAPGRFVGPNREDSE
jgi:N-acyl-D-aspartate/D-glutamate deacylase